MHPALKLIGWAIAPLIFSLPIAHFPLPSLAQARDAQESEAEKLLSLCRSHLNEKQYQAALESCHRAAIAHRAIGNRDGETRGLNNLGLAHFDLNQYPEAIQVLQQALTVVRQMDHSVPANRELEVLVLSNLGDTYQESKQVANARACYQQALAIAQKTPRFSNFKHESSLLQKLNVPEKIAAEQLIEQGNKHYEANQFEAAIQPYEKALKLYREIGDRQGQFRALGLLSATYGSLGYFDKQLAVNQQNLVLVEPLGASREKVTILMSLGSAYDSLGNHAKAVEYAEQGLALARTLRDYKLEVSNLATLRLSYLTQGNYLKATQYTQQQLDIARAHNDQVTIAWALRLLGTLSRGQSDYVKAIEFYQQAIQVTQAIPDSLLEGQILQSLAVVYVDLGEEDRAIKLYQQSLDIARKLSRSQPVDHPLYKLADCYPVQGVEAGALLALGKTYLLKQPDYSKAIDHFEQVLALAKRYQNACSTDVALGGLALVYRVKGDPAQALNYSQQALADIRRVQNPRFKTQHRGFEAGALSAIAGDYAAMGNFPRAFEYYRQALAIAQTAPEDSYNKAVTLLGLGQTFLLAGQPAEAESTLRESLEYYEQTRDKLNRASDDRLADAYKISFLDYYGQIYQWLQRALVAQNKTDKALEVAEQSRARAVADLLSKRLSTKTASANGTGQLSPRSLTAASPAIVQIRQIAKDQQATLVVYSTAGIADTSALYIWVVQPDGNIAFRQGDLKHLKTPLANLVNAARQSIGARGREAGIVIVPTPDRIRRDQERQTQQLRQLHKLLITPIADLLPTNPKQRVVFIPQSELFLVPFPALQDANGKYLIEQHTILTAPSTQVLDLTRKKRDERRETKSPSFSNPLSSALIVGNPTMPKVSTQIGVEPMPLTPLQGAENEAIAIANLLKTNAIIGKQATKTSIMQQMLSARMIHLATHGLLDDFKGLGVPGAIALAPAGNGQLNDGLLTADEILGMKLTAELVVLSACDTGRGAIKGDGVIGLSRSLFVAGVPSVIVSLWKVPDDSTAFLMTEFYKNWKDRKLDKAQALRQAMLTTMKTNPNPKDWAAFTLIGEAE